MTIQATIATAPLSANSVVSRYLPVVARTAMGLVFFGAGLSGLLNLVPPPETPMPENAMAFATGMMKAGYFFPLLKGTETVVGALLLSGRFVPLALAIIAPIVINIFAFHAFLTPEQSLVIPALLVIIEVYLAYVYRAAYRPLLVARAGAGAR